MILTIELKSKTKQHAGIHYLGAFRTVDGRNPCTVEVGSLLSHYSRRVLYAQVVSRISEPSGV